MRSSIREEATSPSEERATRRVVRKVRPDSQRISKPLDNPRDLTELEDVPAYKRKKVLLEDNNKEKDTTQSKLSINLDANDGPIIQRNNSFFHNNVD